DADHAHKARLVGLRYVLGMQRSVSPDKVRMLVNVVENFRNQVKHRRRNQSYKSLSSDPQNLVDEFEPAIAGALRNRDFAHLEIKVEQGCLCQDRRSRINRIIVCRSKSRKDLLIL